jgi:hypothetical protein
MLRKTSSAAVEAYRRQRRATRDPDDYYPTPAWCVHRLLESVKLPTGIWIEPSAGIGSIIVAVNQVRADVKWHAVEHGSMAAGSLATVADRVFVGTNYLGWDPPVDKYDVCLMNPPYKSALAHVQKALTMSRVVAALLRLNWLASDDRAAWMRENTPDVFVLPDRPSFRGGGGDQTEYAWMVWWNDRSPKPDPFLMILNSTPLSERRYRGSPYSMSQQLVLPIADVDAGR